MDGWLLICSSAAIMDAPKEDDAAHELEKESGTAVHADHTCRGTKRTSTQMSGEPATIQQRDRSHHADVVRSKVQYSDKGLQVQNHPYRLRVLPIITVESSLETRRWLILMLRFLFSQLGLAIVLVSWTMCCAIAFHYSEGPNEERVIETFVKAENGIAIDLSTQLRQIGTEGERSSFYPSAISRQLARHSETLLLAVEQGYVRPGSGRIWNYSGCVLFAVSLLTTLGFGAPVPHTNCGRAAAVIFATFGVPLHFLLMFNIAQTILSKMQGRCSREDAVESIKEPEIKDPLVGCSWGCVMAAAFAYYILGIIIFGIARGKEFRDAVLFPLEFVNNSALIQVGESMRLLYAIYLEGLILHAALFFAVIRRSSGGNVEDLAFRNNLLTNAS